MGKSRRNGSEIGISGLGIIPDCSEKKDETRTDSEARVEWRILKTSVLQSPKSIPIELDSISQSEDNFDHNSSVDAF